MRMLLAKIITLIIGLLTLVLTILFAVLQNR